MNQTFKFSFAGFAALVLTPQAFAIDAQPLNQGGFELTPTLSVDARYDDNWTEANSSERSSWITKVAPSLKGSAKRDKTELTLGLDLSKEFVEDSSAANNSDYTVSAGVHLEPSSQSRIDLNASYTDEEDIQNSEDFTDKNVGVTYGFGAEEAKIQLTAGAAYQEKRLSNTSDFDATSWNVRGDYRLSGKTRATAEYRSKDIDTTELTGANSLDGSLNQMLVGVVWDATAKTSGSAKVGRIERKFDNATLTDKDGSSWEVGVVWTPTKRSTVTLDVNNAYETGSATENFIDTETTKIAWNHQWTGRMYSDVALSRKDEHYINDANNGNKDETDELSASLTYSLKRNVDLIAGVTIKDKTSSEAGSGYDQNVYNVGVKVGL